jgi:predicted RNA-binding Zn-ribbon protein involved in translation (DUF1610 family)
MNVDKALEGMHPQIFCVDCGQFKLATDMLKYEHISLCPKCFDRRIQQTQPNILEKVKTYYIVQYNKDNSIYICPSCGNQKLNRLPKAFGCMLCNKPLYYDSSMYSLLYINVNNTKEEKGEKEDKEKEEEKTNNITEVYNYLKTLFPFGHPSFLDITFKELQLHNDKNHDYAAGGRPLGNFERVASILSLYPNFPINKPVGVCIAFMLKQFDAALWMLSNGHEAKVEGVEKRLEDVHVYAKIARCILIDEENAGEKK